MLVGVARSRVVTAAAPTRMPEVTKGVSVSKGLPCQFADGDTHQTVSAACRKHEFGGVRRQRDNALRAGSDEAVLSSLAIAWEPQGGFGVALTADNLTDDDYQQFPGTPAVGRQVSLSARYQW